MARNPVGGRELDDRFEWVITDGPSWGRLCDALKYQGIHDHVRIEFTWQRADGSIYRVGGRVTGIVGPSRNPDLNPMIMFIPSYNINAHPTPLEITYWPHRRSGHVVNVERRNEFVATP